MDAVVEAVEPDDAGVPVVPVADAGVGSAEPAEESAAVVTGGAPESEASAAQRPAHAHARSGLIHWAATAGALGAVIAAAVIVAPAQGAPRAAAQTAGFPTSGPKALPASAGPDPAKAALPLDCGPFPVKVSLRFAAEPGGGGTPETVFAAHCAGGNGTPPDGVYILTSGPAGKPVVAQTLVRPTEDLSVVSLMLRSDGTITARARGYSSAAVPRCCADLNLDLSWAMHGQRYIRTKQVAPLGQT